MTTEITIRETGDEDLPGVLAVHRAAFGRPDEALLTEALLADPSARPLLSLLAADAAGAPIGHVLFTNAELDGPSPAPVCRILAPLAVAPSAQRGGVGSALVRRGLALLAAEPVDLVFVLGDPGYYRRFGFAAAGRLGLAAPYSIPPEVADAWMVRSPRGPMPEGWAGTLGCADALARVEYWRE